MVGRFGKVKFEVSVDFQVKWTVGCISLELKKEVWAGEKNFSHQCVYGLNPEDWMRSPKKECRERKESRTEPVGTPTVRAQGGLGGRTSKADRKGATSAKGKTR